MIITTLEAPFPTASRLRRALNLCVAKSRTNIQALAGQPTTWAFAVDGHYAGWKEGFFEIGNWTTSFHAGMALLAWRETGDDHFLHHVRRLNPLYQEKVGAHAADTMHDLGFLYSLYAVALHRITDDNHQRDLGLKAARVLADRFVPEGGYIRAWGRMDEADSDYAGLAIIDCLMNLPLLYWASGESGDRRFEQIANRHADTTLEWFIRDDDSVYHAFRFDANGRPTGGANYCGRSIQSHWARGTSWAIYGFAIACRYTGNFRYLDASLRLARRFISLLDDEVVPLWDFRLDADAPRLRDSSAAAVAACALLELEALGAADAALIATKDALLDKLCSDIYLDFDPAVQGVLRFGQVGDGVGRAKSAYTSWGDYYLMEGLVRQLGMRQSWW